MPCTMFDATRPLSGLASPASTAESSVKNAHAHADEQIGAHARCFAVDFALQSDKAAQQAGHEQTAECAVRHNDLLQPTEVEGLRELCEGQTHLDSLPDAITAPVSLLSGRRHPRRKSLPKAGRGPRSGRTAVSPWGCALTAAVDLVAVEGKNDRRVCCGCRQSLADRTPGRSR